MQKYGQLVELYSEFRLRSLREVADFSASLPFTTFQGKHDAAVAYFANQRATVVLVQEAKGLSDHASLLETCRPILSLLVPEESESDLVVLILFE